MDDISLTPLALADAPALMALEAENRAWFEARVPPRPEGYWRLDSLEEILRGQLDGADAMFLIRKGPELARRPNLTGFADGTAQLGYRVGRAFCGRGTASRAVTFGLVAADGLGLRAVEARVKSDNPASARVLAKTGFDEICGDGDWRHFRRALDADLARHQPS